MFFNFHQHSTYSFLDGYGLPEQFAERIKDIGGKGMALTEHGNIFSHIPFQKVFHREGLHLVYGCEFYVVEKASEKKRGYYHTTVIAKTNEGYQNLLKLINLSSKENQFYYKPRIDFKQLKEFSKGLVILSGCCCDGYLIKNTCEDKEALFQNWIDKMHGCEWYVELQPFSDEKHKWDYLVEMSTKYGLPCLVTADSHYPSPNHKDAQDLMLTINMAKKDSDPDRLKMEYSLHLPGTEEIIERCKEMGHYKPEWVYGTWELAQQCQVDLPKAKMIQIGGKIGDIRFKCIDRLRTFPVEKRMSRDYIKRLDYELDLIDKKGFIDYFLIIEDIIDWAKKRMLVAPGRGSSAGSLVCYLLRITEIDPLEHDLLFQRFIDINRSDLPDIDIDFPSDRRQEVIEYIKNKYGKNKVASLITFSTFKPRVIIQDSARAFDINIFEARKAGEDVIERSKGDERALHCLEDSVKTIDGLSKFYNKHPKMKRGFALEGQIRQSGTHAAAVILSNEPLETITSIDRNGNIGIDGDYIEEYGFLKIDVLGIEAVSVIQDVCNEVGFDYNELYNVDITDSKVYKEIYQTGKMAGIFQFEGRAVKQTCESIKPSKFNQLVDIVALARPGTLQSGSTEDYIKRNNGAKFDAGFLGEYTEDTKGIVIFQEQVMQIVRGLGGFSWEDTIAFRKGIGKKLGNEYLAGFKEKFILGAEKKGMRSIEAQGVWTQICTHGAYSFNKSHAVAYALLGFWSAWVKTYYPKQFYARILRDKEDLKIKQILREYGGSFTELDLNKSKVYFSVQDEELVGGWTNIPGIAEKGALKIVERQPYEGLEDFASRNAKGVTKNVSLALEEGLEWGDTQSLKEKYKDIISETKLTVPLTTCHEMEEKNMREGTIIGTVTNISLRDHNEPAKLKARGYALRPPKYIILRIYDDHDEQSIYIDRHITSRCQTSLLSLHGAVCLFKVKYAKDAPLSVLKFKILERKESE